MPCVMPIDAHLPCVTLPMPTPIGAPLPPVFGEKYPAECRSVVGFPCLFVMLLSLSVESRSCDWFLVCLCCVCVVGGWHTVVVYMSDTVESLSIRG